MKLENRIVVITGAGAGIGRAAARRFAEKGAILHLIDIDASKAESAALECARLGARTTFHSADCRDPIAVKRVADEIFEREAVVDVLFLNAGVGFGGAIADMTLEDWRWVLDINLYGVIHGIDAFLKRMIAQGPGGHVMVTASMLGLFSAPTVGAYATSKHALIGLCDALRAEVHQHGIEVTALCPGLVGSDIIKSGRMLADGMERSRIDRIWKTRGATPDAIGKIAVKCVEKRKGGVQLAAPTGRVLYDLRRFAPSIYARVLSTASYFLARSSATASPSRRTT